MSIYENDIDIVITTSPKDAIRWVKENSPDCVISDYKMPEMDGIELTRRLRQTSQVPVILYTNQSEEGLLEEAFDAGVNDYIKKENDALHYSLLLRRIKNAVDKHRLELMAGNLVN